MYAIEKVHPKDIGKLVCFAKTHLVGGGWGDQHLILPTECLLRERFFCVTGIPRGITYMISQTNEIKSF